MPVAQNRLRGDPDGASASMRPNSKGPTLNGRGHRHAVDLQDLPDVERARLDQAESAADTTYSQAAGPGRA